MTAERSCAAFASSVMLAVMTACASTVFANGVEFFAPASRQGQIDLAYVGAIHDRTGHRLDYVDLTITAKDGSMTFPFSNDGPGHYRSPDIGGLIKEIGEAVDPSQLEITCYVSGYKLATRSLPRKNRGVFEVDFVMDEDGAAPRDPLRETTSARTRVPAAGLMLILLSAGGARLTARRKSTNST
jgi:hypothetical protein